MVLFFLFMALFTGRPSLSLPLSEILNAQNPEQLEELLKKDQKQSFLELLCKKQKSSQKIPTACYELGLSADSWCLNLALEDLRQIKELEKALKSKSLSEKCRNHLKKREAVLKYRQKDFFIPDLKNYFTAEKPFF